MATYKIIHKINGLVGEFKYMHLNPQKIKSVADFILSAKEPLTNFVVERWSDHKITNTREIKELPFNF